MQHYRGEKELYAWGLILFMLGMAIGFVEYWLPNPRMGNTAHLGCVTNAAFLVGLASMWSSLNLTPKEQACAVRLLLGGTYIGCTALLLGAIWNTQLPLTPFSNGTNGTPWQKLVVSIGLFLFGPMQVVGTIIALRGLLRPGGPGVRGTH